MEPTRRIEIEGRLVEYERASGRGYAAQEATFQRFLRANAMIQDNAPADLRALLNDVDRLRAVLGEVLAIIEADYGGEMWFAEAVSQRVPPIIRATLGTAQGATPMSNEPTITALSTLYAVRSPDGLWLLFNSEYDSDPPPATITEDWGPYRPGPLIDGLASYWTTRMFSTHFGNYERGMREIAREAGGELVIFHLAQSNPVFAAIARERDRLAEWIKAHGQHPPACEALQGLPCSCGLDRLKG